MLKGTMGAALVSRNDNWGKNLIDRSKYCLNSMLCVMDEVIYVDWNSPNGRTMIDEIRPDLLETGRLKVIVVTPEQASELTGHDPEAEPCCEVFGRNIGLRRLTTDWKVSTNIDIVAPSRVLINVLDWEEDTFYTVSRRPITVEELKWVGGFKDIKAVHAHVERVWRERPGQPRAGAFDGDRWALIGNCGDFQAAKAECWEAMRGFDENLIYRGYADGNVQRKADYYGFKIAPRWDFPIMHIYHYPAEVAMKHNHWSVAMRDFAGTPNTEDWGAANMTFEEFTI